MSKQESKLKKKIIDFVLWAHYNKLKTSIPDIEKNVSKFLLDTSGTNKYCHCENKSKACNYFWPIWHCTTCLKPLKNQ